jgi:iron complex transport system permease protein
MRRLPVEQAARQRYAENQGIPGSNLFDPGIFFESAITMTASMPSTPSPPNPIERQSAFRFILLPMLTILLLLLIVSATGLGYIQIGPTDIVRVLLLQVGGALPADLAPSFPFVVMEVRLPRILCAALVGGSLAVAGCVFQSLLHNPLADPYTLGISSGAAFGASLAILLLMFGLALPGSLIIPLFAFIGAVSTLYVVFSLSAPSARLSSNSLILSGIIISAILSAGISLIKFLADEQVNAIIFWLMGSFIGSSWFDVAMLLMLVLPSCLLIGAHARELDIMSFGDRTSDSLGIDSPAVRKRLLIVASLATAACVSVSGIIGFIGLIVPHFVRMALGPGNRLLIPCSFLCGAMLLLLADTITRVLLPTELPIGVLTALIGGPFFCYIFRRNQLERWR